MIDGPSLGNFAAGQIFKTVAFALVVGFLLGGALIFVVLSLT